MKRMRNPARVDGHAPRNRVGLLAALLLAAAGCVSQGPVAPLVPLPDSEMPTPEQLTYHPTRVIVMEAAGRYLTLNQAFAAELRNQLLRYGIEHLSTDERTNRMIEGMLRLQLQGKGETDIKDVTYELSQASGVISVNVNSMVVSKNNELSTWKDKEGKIYRSYTSEVQVSGSYTLTLPKTGTARDVQFSNSETCLTYDKPHQFSAEAMAIEAVRKAARSQSAMEPLYTEFPLRGYVVGTGETSRDIVINRGSDHKVQVGRQWDLVLESKENNPLLGNIVSEKMIGTAKTVEVSPQTCVARCDSSKTRERVKLGMKARARGFGFSLTNFLLGQ